jgi:hypothetical protein
MPQNVWYTRDCCVLGVTGALTELSELWSSYYLPVMYLRRTDGVTHKYFWHIGVTTMTTCFSRYEVFSIKSKLRR